MTAATLLFAANDSVTAAMLSATEFITHVPVEADGLTAAGVRVWCDVGRLPGKLYVEIDKALNAKAVAAGVNMPVGLDPTVWLHRCRRCDAPFIDLPRIRMCSDQCRALAKRDAALKSKAKRAGRHESRGEGHGRFVCAQCGQRRQAWRSTKRYCSMRCRVAAHRGVPAAEPEPMTQEELDRQIADARSVLGGFQIIGCNDPAFVQRLAERIMALEAERRALAMASLSSP